MATQAPIEVDLKWEDGKIETVTIPWETTKPNSKVIHYTIPKGAVIIESRPPFEIPKKTLETPIKWFRVKE